jgi:hypothetical protein
LSILQGPNHTQEVKEWVSLRVMCNSNLSEVEATWVVTKVEVDTKAVEEAAVGVEAAQETWVQE